MAETADAGIEALTARVEALQAKVVATTEKVTRLKEEAKGGLDAMTQLTALANSAKYNVDALNLAMQDGRALASGFAVTFKSLLDIQEAISSGYQDRPEYRGNAGANDRGYSGKVAASLEDLIGRLRGSGSGKNSFLAGMLDNVVQSLEGGIITPSEAISTIQDLLRSYEPGIISDIGAGRDLTARNLAAELERLIHGGVNV